jgi:Tfp pilus assembly protein PilO
VNRSAWLRYWAAWAVPGVIVAIAVVWLAVVRETVLGRGPYLERQVKQVESDVRKLEGQRSSLQAASRSLVEVQATMSDLRERELGSMRARLVPFLIDVVQRANEAGLRVERISYQAKREEKSGLVHFTAGYEVDGTYDQIRRCVYLLETSPQYIVIERIGLRGSDDATSLEVSVRLAVGTYFFDLDEKLMKELGVAEVAGEAGA